MGHHELVMPDAGPGFELEVCGPPGISMGVGGHFSTGAEWAEALLHQLSELPDWLAPLYEPTRVAQARAFETVLAGESEPGPALVVGFGGSCLGLKAADAARRVAHDSSGDHHELRILDTLDPERVRDCFEWAQSRGAQSIFISKSGRTVEVSALLEYYVARGATPDIAIWGPGDHPLRRRCSGMTELRAYEISADTGGRYSVFGPVCQVPLAMLGHNPGTMAEAARTELRALAERAGAVSSDAEIRAGLAEGMDPEKAATGLRGLAALSAALEWRRRHPAPVHVLWCYDETWLRWGDWLAQLDCESLSRSRDSGRRHGEFVAVLRGPADQHSVAQHLVDGPRDKRVTLIESVSSMKSREAERAVHGQQDRCWSDLLRLRAIECAATHAALPHPRRRILVDAMTPVESLAVLMLHCMLETVIWAAWDGHSPYGQPGVEAIKRGIHARWPQGQSP